jgi:hypothetical protein
MALYVCKKWEKVTRGQSTKSETFAKKNNCKKLGNTSLPPPHNTVQCFMMYFISFLSIWLRYLQTIYITKTFFICPVIVPFPQFLNTQKRQRKHFFGFMVQVKVPVLNIWQNFTGYCRMSIFYRISRIPMQYPDPAHPLYGLISSS